MGDQKKLKHDAELAMNEQIMKLSGLYFCCVHSISLEIEHEATRTQLIVREVNLYLKYQNNLIVRYLFLIWI